MPVTTRLQKKQQKPITINVLNKERCIEQEIIEHEARKPKPDDFMDKEANGNIHWCPSWNTCCENAYDYSLYKLRLEEWELHYGALILLKLKNQQVTPNRPISGPYVGKVCKGPQCKGKHVKDQGKYPKCVYNNAMKKPNRKLDFGQNKLNLRNRTVYKD
jgi:hypothetical protein